MHIALGALRYSDVSVYLADVLIPSKTEVERLQKLKKVLATLKEEELTLNLKKC